MRILINDFADIYGDDKDDDDDDKDDDGDEFDKSRRVFFFFSLSRKPQEFQVHSQDRNSKVGMKRNSQSPPLMPVSVALNFKRRRKVKKWCGRTFIFVMLHLEPEVGMENEGHFRPKSRIHFLN